ncbi:hypothetical protein LOB72_06585, partial [Lactobacillus delbrueckii subsp. lactis]|nr:hypothetical protein [Lactobacillus delbrueckii subsp. lactis]
MNYTELSVATQDVMPNKGVLFFKSGLSDFIQVGEPIQNEDGLTFVGKLDECDMTPEIRTLISGVIFMTKYTKEIKLAIYHEWVDDHRRGTYLS